MSSWQILKKSFHDFYEHLFFLGAISLLWFFTVGLLSYVGVAGFFLKQFLPVFLNLLLVGPLTLAAFLVTYRLIIYQEVKLRDYFRAIREKFWRGMLAYWISLVIFLILVVDFLFFLNFGNKILFYLSGIWIYLLIFFSVSQFYFWSLLVQLDDPLGKLFKKSLLMALDNLLFSLGIFLSFILLLVLGIVSAGIVLAVGFIGFLGVLANNATHKLLVKYELKEELSPPYNMQ